jgi:hypothetical protein
VVENRDVRREDAGLRNVRAGEIVELIVQHVDGGLESKRQH